MTLVIDGGWTPSLAASSPGVNGPHFSRQDSAESWVNVITELVRCARSRRFNRTTANLRRLANAVLPWPDSDMYLAYLTKCLAGLPLPQGPSLRQGGLDRADCEVGDEGGRRRGRHPRP